MKIDWANWPREWPRTPPGWVPPRIAVPRPSSGVWDALNSNPQRYWFSVIFGAIVASRIWEPFLLYLLILAAMVWFGARGWDAFVRDDFLESAKAARAKMMEFEAQAWNEWFATRPMRLFAISRTPALDARKHLLSRNGNIFLGITTTVYQEFVTAGPRQTVVVIGPSGSGKTLAIAIVSVALHPGAAVFSTTKADGLRYTAAARSHLGRLWLYDPTHAISNTELAGIERQTGTRIYRAYWSPLLGIGGWNEAKLSAKDLVTAARYGENSDPSSRHWSLMSEAYLAPMLLAAALHPDGSMNLLRRWIRHNNVEECEAILLAIAHNPDLVIDAELALDSLRSRKLDRNVKHASDVWSTLNTLIEAYEFKEAVLDANRNNFDPRQFIRTGDTLYIAGNAKRQEAASPLYIGLIDALYDAAVELELRNPFGQGRTRPSLLVTLDEAANTAPSPRLIRYLSEGAGQGFQLMVLLQSGAQAETIWRRNGRALLDFPAVKVIFGGISDHDTLEAFSVLGGDYDREYATYSTNQSIANNWGTQYGKSWASQGGFSRSESSSQGTTSTFGSSETVSHHKERRFTPGDIATLPPGEALVVMHGKVQVVKAGGQLIPAWLHILNAYPQPQKFLEPREISRATLNLAHIDELLTWAKPLVSQSPQGLPDDDDDDDDTPRYALPGPGM